MSLPLVILGTGGSVYDVLDIIESINAIAPSWEVIGFLDDARPAGTWHLDLEILGPLDEADLMHGHTFVNAIGSDKTFRRLPRILASTGLTADRYPTLVHPAASVSSRARLGQGVTVNYGVSVGEERPSVTTSSSARDVSWATIRRSGTIRSSHLGP